MQKCLDELIAEYCQRYDGHIGGDDTTAHSITKYFVLREINPFSSCSYCTKAEIEIQYGKQMLVCSLDSRVQDYMKLIETRRKQKNDK